MSIILNNLTAKLAQKALVGGDDFLFKTLDRKFHIPAEWTTLQRSVMSACPRPRIRKIAKWLGVTVARRRDPRVPGLSVANRGAIEGLYGYKLETFAANPFLIAGSPAMNERTFNLLSDHFWGDGSAAWREMWIETRDRLGNHLIEDWRCNYDGRWFRAFSTLRLVLCRNHENCESKRTAALPWLKDGAYALPGWPAVRLVAGLGRNKKKGGLYGGRQKTRWEMVRLLQSSGQAKA